MSEQPQGAGPGSTRRAPEPQRPETLAAAMLRAAAALREAEIPFMLCGSMACWARGGPEPFTKDDLLSAIETHIGR